MDFRLLLKTWVQIQAINIVVERDTLKKRYISPDKKQQIINELTLAP